MSSRNSLSWLHGGDLIARQIEEFGVRHVFTLTGGHISALYDGARWTDLTIVDFRHEQAAVHAADALARLRRDVSVAALTAGPGVTGGLTAVAAFIRFAFRQGLQVKADNGVNLVEGGS